MENPRTNGEEWQTAGKAKATKPKPKQVVSAVETNILNGHAPVNAGLKRTEGTATSGQNGLVYNGGSNRRGRQSSTSSYGSRSNHTMNNAQYSRPTSSKEDALSKRKLLEKDSKNIAKRDAAIERVGTVFSDELEKSRDYLRQVFEEIRNHVNEREQLVLEELGRCKKEGADLLVQQEKRAKELKDGTSQLSKMSDRQIDDLRSQIRRFMTDHRFEDELCKPARFRCELDQLVNAIKTFGEVVPVVGSGGEPQKHSSMSSLVSSGDGDGSNSVSGSKAVSEVVIGGIVMKSDSMDVDQLAELTRSLRENLKLQGIAEDILPEVCGGSGAMPTRRRPAPPRRDDRNGGGNGARR